MNQHQDYKRNHHYLPKLYLKGFTESSKNPFVWVYQRQDQFNPGYKRHNNPQRQPISRVGMERDHYAYEEHDGSMNYDKYENILETIEKPADPIFAKLRNHCMISNEEKQIFASYIFSIFKRVPTRIERFKVNWPETFASVSSEIFSWLDFEESITLKDNVSRFEKIGRLRNEVVEVLEYYKNNIHKSEIPLTGMVKESVLGMPEIMANMTWQFYKSPSETGFFTSDNPIFTPGLNKSYSEVSFSISNDIAIIMSWYEIEEGFFDATPELVMEINRRTVNNAQNEIYFSSAEKWVVDLFKEKREGYFLIYPYSASMFE